MSERDDEIVRLYKSGLTLRQVGERVGLTGARVHQILKAEEVGTRSREKHLSDKSLRFIERGPLADPDDKPQPFIPVTLSCGTRCYAPRFHSSPGLEVICPGAEAIFDSPISCGKKHVATIRGPVRRSA